MASAILHIKDSYYFEVPKALLPCNYGTKSEFPELWVQLDDQFQAWEASRLYDEFKSEMNAPAALLGNSKRQVLDEYEHWKHEDHANAGKPFDRFLEEHHAKDWFAEQFALRGVPTMWSDAKVRAGDVELFKQDATSAWSPQKIHDYNEHLSGKILIPQPFGELRNFYERESGFAISRFMIIEVVIALILWAVFAWLGRQTEEGERPRGRLWNLLEAVVVFIRDQVARPAIGEHEADRFVPLLLTLFFFILGCNLFGMLPWLGAPSGELAVTAGMACVTFGAVVLFGCRKFGLIGFILNQVPSMDLPWFMAIFLKPMILVIELLGLVIKHAVLAVRLLANMVAGHMTLLAIMGLTFSIQAVMEFMPAESPHPGLDALAWSGTAVVVVLGSTVLSVLELFVAFLQAYIFTFLSALFIGAAVHHH
ncbi:MAG: ATP synthase F0 subunit A [Planctomycetaceae bacterium]|nr:ATP synthase F0 subunit A [Planctomycetaceae bacterium]